ncbi:MAG: AsmA family protein [Sphingobacteriales bacterium]|nr:AsmA family protein [Sphingobacteriales bacterium]
MQKPKKSILFKILKISGISVAAVLALLFILPYLFPDTIASKVKQWVNGAITSKLEFSNARLSFFNHFPSLTLTLQDISLTGSAPFEKDTLVSAKQLSFGIDLSSLFSESVRINQIFLTGANIDVKVDALGNANYNVYRSDAAAATDTSTSGAGLRLESIVIENSDLRYSDLSVPLTMSAENLNYTGSGDLSKAVFDLSTRLSADAFSFTYAGESYINQKQLRAKLVTKVNTKSLALVFEKNRIRINKLPVQFSGTFDFLQSGYNMDLQLDARKTTLENIITAIPPDLTGWLDNTKVKGDAVFNIRLKGKYIAETNTMPDLQLGLKVREGYIAYKGAPYPVENMFLNLEARLPSLNTDSLDIQIDSLYFTVDKGYCSIISHTTGLEQPYIAATVKADLDLEKWDKAIGLNDMELRGQCNIDLHAKGQFRKGQNPDRWRKDIIVTGIPSFTLSSSVHNGYFRYASLPEAVHDISFGVRSSCPDSNYRHVQLEIDNINLTALKNVIKGYIRITDPENLHVDADLSGNIHLKDIAQCIPVENLNLSGDILVDVKINGIYNKEKKLFPVTKAKLSITDAEILTGYYPHPVTRINVLTEIENADGSLSGTSVVVHPVSFEFEGQPFTIQANLKNPEDLEYKIASNGTIDLGKIYRVFAVKGYDASGFLSANIALKGKQSDAAAGRYHLLVNSGQLRLKEVALRMEAFPKAFNIHSGVFRFQQDKMWFDEFKSNYGTSSLVLNGYLENVINYVVQNDAVLKGKLTLTADRVNLNEFTAFEAPADTATVAAADTAGAGVIMIPKNVSLVLAANAKEVHYNDVAINDFKGQLWIDQGKVQLKETGFRLAGATFMMDAFYEGITPYKGSFDFKVKADSFSIAKAYNDIPMFREMASSASGVQGIVGMDYSLSGRLDQNMYPIYPSLKGGGVLTLKKVKLKGFKLMNAVSHSADYAALKDPDLSGINLKTTISNNVITLDRVKLRIAGLRPRFEGQVSMDGELNIKGRIGLPPLGIIGIPFTVSGTSEDPVVKLKRDKTGKVLQEKEDTEEAGESEPAAVPVAPQEKNER